MRETLKKHIINARGSRLDQKYVVFESDDWGAIRIPNLETRDELLQKGLTRKNDPFSQCDSLETTQDYKMLFEVLKKHTDKNGHYPVITANFILNNPDFDKIAANDFKKYYSESFIETYKKYPDSEKAWELLNVGIDDQLIMPQFHGSEHLNVIRWMNKLKAGDERFRFAFEKKCYAIDEIGNENRRQNLMATYDYNNDGELAFLQKSIKIGLKQFEEIFGFKSITNISPCYVWDSKVEQELLKGGVKAFQGSFLQNYPITGESFKKKYRYIGQKNKDEQLYFVRNCLFEPSLNTNIDWVSKCMESIDIAFKWGKPAIIGTHRINFSGRLDTEQRDNNLKLLEQLLTKILEKWPDVKFTDSSSLLQKYIK
jgi:hypothetical protein